MFVWALFSSFYSFWPKKAGAQINRQFLGWLHAAHSRSAPGKTPESCSSHFGLLRAGAGSKSPKDKFTPPLKFIIRTNCHCPVPIRFFSPRLSPTNTAPNSLARVHRSPSPPPPVPTSATGDSAFAGRRIGGAAVIFLSRSAGTQPPRPLHPPPATPHHWTASTRPNPGHRPLGSPAVATVISCASIPLSSVRSLPFCQRVLLACSVSACVSGRVLCVLVCMLCLRDGRALCV